MDTLILKIENRVESLLELVLKKICKTVLSYNYVMLSTSLQEAALGVFGNVTVFSKIEVVESLLQVHVARKA